MEQIRIIKEMHKEYGIVYPRFMVWENVPGALSSNKGEDFRVVLEETARIAEADAVIPGPPKGKWKNSGCVMGDGWSIAWRILDAQFWGVPQRRRRIALVADFGGESAPEILFERKGVSGYTPQGFRSWQGAARGASPCVGATGFDGYNGELTGDVSATLGVNCGMSTGRNGIVLNDQGGSHMDITDEVTCTLRAESHHPPCVMDAPKVIPLEHHPTDSRIKIEESDAIQTLTSRMGTGGGNVPLVMRIRSGCEGGGKGALIQNNKSATIGCNNDQTVFVPKAYGICSKQSHSMLSDNPKSGFYEADTSRCLDANGGNPSCNQGGMAVVAVQGSMIGRAEKNGPQGSGINEDVSFTLDAADRHAVAYGIDRAAFNQGKNAQFGFAVQEETQPTMVAKGPGAVAAPTFSISKASFFTSDEEELANTLVATDWKDPPVVNDMDEDLEYIVRRLTPTECERLQGFPDGWTDIGDYTDSNGKKKKSSDTARYKALGNSIALPPWRWVLSRLCSQYKTPATMGSLFDGIGGFPLIWEEINGKGSCLWASEIEEFPIAVTKIRFSE